MAQTPKFSIRQLSPAIGAVIQDIDLSSPLDKETIQEINNALVTYQVIFFEKQQLTPERQRDIAKEFGELHIHPIFPHVPDVPEIIVFDNNPNNLPTNDNWHTDVTCIQNPPLGSMLTAKIVPPCGGDTTWSSSIAAYNALSEPMRKFLDGLTAVHDFRKGFTAANAGGDEQKFAEACRKNPPMTHPVVRVHPVTGKKGLFVNWGYTTRINELTKAESDVLLDFLYAHSSKPDFTVRWKWSVGDVAFWDNRLTQHYALADYMPHRRVMHRATILGCKPRGPNDTV